MKSLNNKSEGQYVLITGGSMGIGFELAKCFAEGGYNLILVSRTAHDLEIASARIKKEHPVEVITIVKDLFEPSNAFELYNEIQILGIEPAILVNNAGQGQFGEFSENDIHRELDIIQLNIASVVVLSKLYLKDMLNRKAGRILNVSSIASQTPGPFQVVYHATKAFVQSFTAGVRDEVKDKGIVITALLPGATKTDFFNKADMLNSKIVVEGELADPAKVAKDGYNALMNGDDKVVSGLMNKIQVAVSNLIPESKVAEMVRNQQEPVSSEKTKN